MTVDAEIVPPYRVAVVAAGFVFVSGQVPRDEQRRVLGADTAAQAVAALERLMAALAQAGATARDVVKTTVYLEDLADASAFNAVYRRFFPHQPPARTLVGARLNGVRVEIDAVAYVGRVSPVGPA